MAETWGCGRCIRRVRRKSMETNSAWQNKMLVRLSTGTACGIEPKTSSTRPTGEDPPYRPIKWLWCIGIPLSVMSLGSSHSFLMHIRPKFARFNGAQDRIVSVILTIVRCMGNMQSRYLHTHTNTDIYIYIYKHTWFQIKSHWIGMIDEEISRWIFCIEFSISGWWGENLQI